MQVAVYQIWLDMKRGILQPPQQVQQSEFSPEKMVAKEGDPFPLWAKGLFQGPLLKLLVLERVLDRNKGRFVTVVTLRN